MRRKNREINIFSMSALDLFASAMGAFILIAVVALPYYLKTDHVLMEDARQAQQQAAQAQQQMERLKREMEQKMAQLEAEKEQAEQERDKAQSELDNTIKFALLGITTQATSYTVLVDMSASMSQYTQLMERTMAQLITPMTDKNEVQVIGFSGDAGLVNWLPPTQTKAMTDTNKQQLNRFVGGLSKRFSGSTPTESALTEALKYNTDAIIVLTDGAPDGNPNQIVSNITRANGGTKEIHSIAVGDYDSDPALVNFLQSLANKNRGGFLGVSR